MCAPHTESSEAISNSDVCQVLTVIVPMSVALLSSCMHDCHKSCMYLAHHELESTIKTIIVICYLCRSLI